MKYTELDLTEEHLGIIRQRHQKTFGMYGMKVFERNSMLPSRISFENQESPYFVARNDTGMWVACEYQNGSITTIRSTKLLHYALLDITDLQKNNQYNNYCE